MPCTSEWTCLSARYSTQILRAGGAEPDRWLDRTTKTVMVSVNNPLLVTWHMGECSVGVGVGRAQGELTEVGQVQNG